MNPLVCHCLPVDRARKLKTKVHRQAVLSSCLRAGTACSSADTAGKNNAPPADDQAVAHLEMR